MRKEIFNLLIYPLLTGFLIFLSYPKISIYPIAFFALVPFIMGLKYINTQKKAMMYGFLTGLFTYIMVLYWIYPTMRAADVNVFISTVSVLMLSSILSIEFIIVSLISYKAYKINENLIIFITPSIWTLVDFIKTEITKYIAYFPWFEISYSQWNNKNILLLSLFGSSYLITFIILISNAIFAVSFVEKNKITMIRKILIGIFIVIMSNLVGSIIKNEISYDRAEANLLKVSIIQPSIDFYIKWDINYVDLIKKRIETLIEKASRENPDLIIWPENALYGWIDQPDVFEWLCKVIKNSKTYHIVGSVSKKDAKHVSLYLISPDCKIDQEYHKRILVPFGEYVPLRKFLGKYISVIGSLGEFEKGSFNQKPIEFKNIKIAPTICYETIFKYLFYYDEDIDLIVNITNDGWYLNTSAPYQHFAAAVFRAVERGKVFIRAANNGISAIIYPDGSITKKLELNSYNLITADIINIKTPSISQNMKNSIVILSFLILLAFFITLPLLK